MARRIPTKDKWKMKTWYEILAPPRYGEKVLGETPASDPELVIGRRVEALVSDLTGNYKQSHMKLLFEIDSVSGTKAKTKLIGYELLRSYLGSIVRRRRRKIELIKDVELKDGSKARVKAVAITFRKCHTSQAEEIRKIMDRIIEEEAKKLDFEELIDAAINYKIQEKIKEEAHKVYPLANMEIRKIEPL